MSHIDRLSTEVPHHVTVEIVSVPLKLRDDLTVSMQIYGGQTCYLIEDPLSSRFYRVGIAEYTLLSMLDGKTTIAQAMGRTAAIMGSQALSEQDVAALCKWLIDSELATTEDSSAVGRLVEVADRSSKRKRVARLSPLFQKLPLLNPDPWVTSLNALFGWIFSRPAFAAWIAVIAYAAYRLASHWDRFVGESSTILHRGNWIWLLACWLVLKLIHESAHALACKRFGGTVREAGVLFILLAPLPYVDVTSSWRFDSKWKRIITAAAGMYAELFVAAWAAIIYSHSDDALLRQHAQNVFVAASVVTLLFNANPLMRFDGYYILSDWLGLPNLASHGSQLLRYIGQRYILGMSVTCPSWPEGKTVWIAAYGLAASAYRILISVILLTAAEAMFFGAGVALAVVAIILAFVIPGARMLRRLIASTGSQRVEKSRLVLIGCLTALTLWLGWNFVPWYARVSAPAIVDFYPAIEVRSPVGGFVREILVAPGDDVSAGQLLLRLENEELKLHAKRLKVEIEQTEQRIRKFRQQHEITAMQVAVKNRQTLETRRKQIVNEIAQLDVSAPVAGQIIDSEMEDRCGTFVQPGSPIVTIGGSQNKRILALVSQQDLESFRAQTGQVVSLHIWGGEQRKHPATVEQINPRATSELTYPALSSLAGGPLAVRTRSLELDQSEASGWQFAEPHFPAVLSSEPEVTHGLKPGQTGVVEFRWHQGTIGKALSRHVTNWLRDRRAQIAD